MNGFIPVFRTMNHNNFEMLKLLIEYSIEDVIKIIINETVIDNLISIIFQILILNYKIYLYKNKSLI